VHIVENLESIEQSCQPKPFRDKWRRIVWYIFRDWNGLQNLVMPSLLLYFFDEHSYARWIVNVLSLKSYFIPLLLYLVFGFGMVFILLKASVMWWFCEGGDPDKTVDVNRLKSWLAGFTVYAHILLGLYLSIFVLLYVAKHLLMWVQVEGFHLYKVYYGLLHFGLIGLFIYCYYLFVFALPVAKRGHGFRRTLRYFHLHIILRKRSQLPVIIVQLIWIYSSALIMNIVCLGLDIGDGCPTSSCRNFSQP